MNKEALIINDKYCVVQTNNSYRLIIKKNNSLDLVSILNLENRLEEEKLNFEEMLKQITVIDNNNMFYELLGILGTLLSVDMIGRLGFKEPVLAPLTMTSFASIKMLQNVLKKYHLKRKIPGMKIGLDNIQSNLKALKGRADLVDETLSSVPLKDKEMDLHSLLKGVVNEEIIEEKHLILRKI